MSFHYPLHFLFYIGLILLVIIHLWVRKLRTRDLINLGDWKVIQNLISVESLKRRRQKEIWVIVAISILIFSATGPQIGSRLKEVKHRGVDVFIAIDTSRSMLAEDVAPSRMERAKQSLGYLMNKLPGNRVGIIAYARDAIIQCPLTVDIEAARMFLDIIDTNTISKQGTSIGGAIRLAVENLKKEEKSGKAIILLTDGEDHRSDPDGAARLAHENGVVIFTIGIGTTKGEVIKTRNDQGKVEGFLKYKDEMVLSRMDEALLSKIAALTGGRYFRASSTDQELDEIVDIINGYDKKEFGSKMYERRKERYQWFLVLAFLILIFEFFRNESPGQMERINSLMKNNWLNKTWWKKLVPMVLLVFYFTPIPIYANVRDHIRKGNKLIQAQDFSGARGEFESALIDEPESAELRYNIANTYYLEGNFDLAKKVYEQAENMTKNPQVKSKIAYNLAHLLFSMGNREDAIEKFKECLRMDPRDQDAKYNIEYIRSGKQPKNPPQNKPPKSGGQKDNQADQSSGSDQKDNGGMSPDQANQIMQMIKDQEKDSLKQSQDLANQHQKKPQLQETPGEDW